MKPLIFHLYIEHKDSCCFFIVGQSRILCIEVLNGRECEGVYGTT